MIANNSTYDDVDDEINFTKILGFLVVNRFKIIIITAVISLFGFMYSLLPAPIYQADALIQLEEKSNGNFGISTEIFGSSAPKSVSEIEIINSRMVLGEVVTNLKINQIAPGIRLNG